MPPWRTKLEDFAGITSMHGAPKVILNRHPLKKIVWFLIFIGSWAMFVCQTQLVFENYFSYPRKTNLEIVYKTLFPSVTVCLKRRVSFYDAEKWSKANHRDGSNSRFEDRTFAYLQQCMKNFEQDLLYHQEFRSKEFKSLVEKSAIPKEEVFVSLSGRLANTSRGDVVQGLFKVYEINGGQFFNCVTVEPLERYIDQIKEMQGTILAGYGMVPNMSNESDYLLGLLPKDEGYRVYVQPVGVRIDPNEERKYFDVQPNHDAEFSISAVREFVRVGLPHGNCSKINPFTSNEGVRSVYRQEDCESLCRTKKLFDVGKVSMYNPPLGGMHCWVSVNNSVGNDSCSRKRFCVNSTHATANREPVEAVDEHYSIDLEDCPCHPPCNEIEYDVLMATKPRPVRDDKDFKFFFNNRYEVNPVMLTYTYLTLLQN